MIELVIAHDPLPDGGQVVTVGQRGDLRITRNPFMTRIEGGPYDGDRWRSASRAEALETHAETVRIFGRRS